jgi:hypothetical protein
MINSTKGGELALRVLGVFVLGGVLSLSFSLLCCFSCYLLVLQIFLLLDDILKLFWLLVF